MPLFIWYPTRDFMVLWKLCVRCWEQHTLAITYENNISSSYKYYSCICHAWLFEETPFVLAVLFLQSFKYLVFHLKFLVKHSQLRTSHFQDRIRYYHFWHYFSVEFREHAVRDIIWDTKNFSHHSSLMDRLNSLLLRDSEIHIIRLSLLTVFFCVQQ